jgi:hypothetical protein
MHRKLLGLSTAIFLLGVGSASAQTTIIGNVGQSSSQAVNSSQSASNGSGGNAIILGNSSPTLTQISINSLSNTQAIGPAYAGVMTTPFTLIGNASQVNNQGVNSQQTGVNGDGGGPGTTVVGGNSTPNLTQGSFNFLLNDIILQRQRR